MPCCRIPLVLVNIVDNQLPIPDALDLNTVMMCTAQQYQIFYVILPAICTGHDVVDLQLVLGTTAHHLTFAPGQLAYQGPHRWVNLLMPRWFIDRLVP